VLFHEKLLHDKKKAASMAHFLSNFSRRSSFSRRTTLLLSAAATPHAPRVRASTSSSSSHTP
jgi:hypothetical protein